MSNEEEDLILAARRWYAAARKNRNPILTHQKAAELALMVVLYERSKGLRHLRPGRELKTSLPMPRRSSPVSRKEGGSGG